MTNPPSEELREKLAAIEHERWADWQKWCHQVLRDNLNLHQINFELERVLERWDRQIVTPYDKLTNQEKASDMEQVDRYWPLIAKYVEEVCLEVIGKNDPNIHNVLAIVNQNLLRDFQRTKLAELLGRKPE